MAEDAKPMSENTRNLIEELYFGTAEKTVAESSYYGDSFIRPYNPDDLWQKTGDYSIYEEMRKDDQIHAIIQLKKDLILGSGWEIKCEDDKQQEIADDIYSRLYEDPNKSLNDLIDEMLDSSMTHGFSLSEKIFQLRQDQSLTLKELKTRHPQTWTIHTDKKGNITKYEQHGSDKDLDINPKSLIHFIMNGRYQNPYGNSPLRYAHAAWFTKRHLIRYYSIFTEKYASPMPYAKYDNNTPKSKVLEIFKIIKKFQQKTAIAFPKSFEVDFLQSNSNGDAYVKGINLFNMLIGRGLLIPDLIGVSGTETAGGSYSLGKEQMDMFYRHIRRIKESIESVINKHIVQPLIVWNYGILNNYPKFKFNPVKEEDSISYAKTFIEAMKGKLYEPSEQEINHFRSLIKFPEGDVVFRDNPEPEDTIDDSEEINDETSGEEENEEIENDDIEDVEEEIENELDNKEKKEYAKAYKSPEGNYSKKVNFKAVSSLLDNTENRIINEQRPIIDEIIEDLIDQIQKKKILNTPPKPERINDLKIKKLKSVQQILKKNLRQHFTEAQLQARSELFKKDFTTPLQSDEFLKFLEDETFLFVGDWEYSITKQTRILLQQAIKDGLPISTVIDKINTDVKKNSIVSIERYSRTKTTEVLNRARVAEFDATKSVQGYQYSAILDDRTSPICEGLHGKKFKAGTEPIPPMHFNCRSVLVPITIFEDYKPDTKVGKTDIDTFIENNKGKGFSTR